jgi:hypothetical protein
MALWRAAVNKGSSSVALKMAQRESARRSRRLA